MQKHPLADCDNCPLRDAPYAGASGPEDAQLLVVGEAPGFQEAMKGVPFVGPSGQLLKQVLEHHGYDPENVRFTNVVACRPPGNANPPKEAVHACSGRLDGELGAVDGRDVLALGSTAGQAVLGTNTGVTQLRVGPPRQLPSKPGTRVVATWHPAYCLRNADAFPALVQDVGKLKGVPNAFRTPEWAAYSDPADILQVLEALRERTDRVVVDIEVGIEKDVAFDHPNEYDLLCVGIAYAADKAVVLAQPGLADGQVLDALGDFLRSVKVTGHNGKFDASGLFPHVGDIPIHFDTMIASYVEDETPGGHGLKELAVDILGAPKYDDEAKKHIPRGGNYADIPKGILHKYNAYDVCATWQLEDYFRNIFDADESGDKWRAHNFMVAAGNELKYLELNGITINLEHSNELRESYLEILDQIEEELNRIAFPEDPEGALNPRSPLQLKKWFAAHDIRLDSTNQDTIELLLRRQLPDQVVKFCVKLLEHRRKQKLYGTYIKGIRNRMYRGRVYTTYLLHGTTSGRLASRNPNLQNIVRDKEIRRQFGVAKPDHILMQADYKQAEGRIIAWLAEDEWLRDIFADPDRDIFNELGAGLYGDKFDPKDKDQRVRVKAYFYGLGYGRTAYSIAMEYGFDVKQTEKDVAAFMRLIPKVMAWQASVKKSVHEGNDLVTPFGRHRRFYLITKENQKDVENEALSYLPQSITSDICLASLVRLRPMLRGLGWIRLTIHDALVVECPASCKEEVEALVRQVMKEEADKIQSYAPFDVDVTYGETWGDL